MDQNGQLFAQPKRKVCFCQASLQVFSLVWPVHSIFTIWHQKNLLFTQLGTELPLAFHGEPSLRPANGR